MPVLPSPIPPNDQRNAIDARTSIEKLNINVPTNLHPDSLGNLAPILVDGSVVDHSSTAYESARRALKALYESSSAIDEAHTSCMMDITVGHEKSTGKPIRSRGLDPVKGPALAQAMNESFARTAAQSEASEKILAAAEDKLQLSVAAALTNPRRNEVGQAQVDSEVRHYVKALKDNQERLSFLHRSIESGDVDIVHAVLAASCWVSGLTPEELARIKDLASERFATRAYKQLHAIRRVKQHLAAASADYVQTYFKKLPRSQTPAAKVSDDSIARLRG
jgi:hypothetical protein